jgi:DNA repair protein RecN (Recombination protein N)
VLVDLRIRGLGAIEDARLDLGPGFTAVTGETGAGKTMVLTGLSLLLGGRGDAGLVRAGHDRIEIEGRFRVTAAGAVARQVRAAGGELDGDELLVVRTVSADGRSRAFVGGRAVPVATVGALADDLVAVHGQSDQRGLLRPAVQRRVLDGFAGPDAATALAAYRADFAELARVRAELDEVTTHRRERAVEADGLRHGIREVEAVMPVAGEDVALLAEGERLGHVDALRRAAASAHDLLSPELPPAEATGDVLGLLTAARHGLETVASHDAALDDLARRLAAATYELAEVATELSSYLAGLDADPARLEAVQQRRAALAALTRRYGDDVTAVLEWTDAARARLAQLDDDDSRGVELRDRRDALLRSVAASATTLSHVRRAAAKRLEAAVSDELHGLAMPHAALVCDVRRKPDELGLPVAGEVVAFGPSGVDEVELLLIPHAGAPARPLHRGASGGELSRVMLAIELVLAGSDSVPTFVFDEVDAGVGGRAAVEVGRRLAALAGTSQVIVVTHLPQVAAYADRHVVVARSEAGEVTSSQVGLVDGESRVRELSRMLAGHEESELALGHAEELLDAAAAVKPGS